MNVLSKSEVLRMKASVANATPEDGNARRNLLKEMSDKRVSRWTDTLAAKRKARLDWKLQKDAREEQIRQDIDEKEAEMQQQHREQTIQRAKHILFERNEKVKFLRSQQMYSQVIEDRENQMKEKQEREKIKILEEEKWHREAMLRIREEEQKEEEKMATQKKKAKEIHEMLKKQKADAETIKKKQFEQQKAEDAQLLRKIAFDDMKAEQKQFLEKLERKKRNKAHMSKMREDAEQKQAAMIEQEKTEVKKREAIIAEQQRLSQARARLEKQHLDRNKNTAALQVARQELELRSKREIELFLRDQKRADENIKAAQTHKAQEREAQQKLIDESRQNQIRLREERKKESRADALQAAKQMQKMALEQQQREIEKHEQQKERNIEIRRYLEKQCAENDKKKAEGRKEELFQAQQMKKAFLLEDNQFKELALREIESFRSQGKKPKNIAMLERAMNVKDVTLLPGVQ